MRARLRRLGMPALQAVLFFVIWSVTVALALQFGWYPYNVGNYVAVGAIAALAILVCREFPLAGLIAIGVITIFPPWYFDQPEIRMIPLVLAGYFATARGVNLFVAAPLTAFFALYTIVPSLTYSWLNGDLSLVFPFAIYDLTDPSTRILSGVVVLSALLVGTFAHRQSTTAAKLHERNEELQALRNADIERIASQERTRIARDIHDVVAHHVSAMVINAQAAEHVADAHPEKLRPAVRSVIKNGQEALTAMRRAVKVLRADGPFEAAALPFEAAMDEIVARVRDTGLTVTATISAAARLSPAAETALLHITQEALTNVMIHSDANDVKVTLAPYAGSVELTVCDNGSGGGADAIVGRRLLGVGDGGSGIHGMRERAEALEGTLESARIEHGWRTVARLPQSAMADSAS
ncbi:sensor histidine kinase [Conyzicola sp.]|uniref:sensor histidine kinase n=1 Tax=Conyzicola sp. TaxID=1969404 RepID=UPI0039890236